MTPLCRLLLFTVLVVALGLRVYRLDFPDAYVYDEVYHVFTARELRAGNRSIWDAYASAPQGVAFEWTHPPIAKEVMALSMALLGSDSFWAARLPGALTGVIAVALLFRLGLTVFGSAPAALIAAFAFSIDGLNFVEARTGVLDIYLVTAVLAALVCMSKRARTGAGVLLGTAVATKWTALFAVPVAGLTLLQAMRSFHRSGPVGAVRLLLLCWPVAVLAAAAYVSSYIPFFAMGNGPEDFFVLQKQMWDYHSGLQATHGYASPWWSWPLSLYPVWYAVQYREGDVAAIYAAGNPAVFCLGAVAVGLTAVEAVRTRTNAAVFVVLGYLAFWLPNALSPRILFLYHYAPAVPFLCLALGYQLARPGGLSPWVKGGILVLLAAGFAAVYPYLTGVFLPADVAQWFFRINLAKNPFGG